MDTRTPVAGTVEVLEDELTQESTRREVLQQLDRITGSLHFRNSKRYPSFLRYIVYEALAGRAEVLKERTLGTCVLGRAADYDTNLDPVVRITAGEVRKRIAQYYQSPGHEHELRIEIPRGSYAPRFFRPSYIVGDGVPNEAEGFQEDPEDQQAAPVSVAPLVIHAAEISRPTLPAVPFPELRPSRDGVHLAVIYSALFVLLVGWGVSVWRASVNARLTPGVSFFWGKTLHSPEPTLIVLGVHSFDEHGTDISALSHASMPRPEQTLLFAMTRSDMVHLSDLTSYGEVVKLLTGHAHPFHTQGAADTTLEQLRRGPFLLIGGGNNLWTRRLTQDLRFRFTSLNGRDNVIQDNQHPAAVWTLDVTRNALANSRDYGLISCFFDPQTEQNVILAAGIGKSGTEAAVDFLTSEKGLDAWFQSAHPPSGANLQVVVSTDVIEGQHGPPHVVASYIW
ncbi:hypothetical protein HNQ77_001516 [Silvibacterium bohemicum]|uniref:Adenylate cyclase n=1 Tax=Silvibacterium bohemicum TaxID=1577686 RepID=A0A841JST9_9BACT|nr:hypothetical protein [Silvibacterium bohemicum]MBB6143567.1 hypothetical protein [Silvibacterium bohemicum]